MRNYFLTISSLLIICLNNMIIAQAPNWSWARPAGGYLDDYPRLTATDLNGNVVVVGFFESPYITFGSIALVNANIAVPTRDVFIVKYDPTGNVLWAKSGTGLSDDEPSSVAFDNSGNVIVTGYYGGYPFKIGTINLPSWNDFFLVKFDPAGNTIWAKSGAVGDYGTSIVKTDIFGNIIIVGDFNFSINFFPFNLNIINPNSTNWDIFIIKYNQNGTILWAKSAGGSLIDNVNSVSTDTLGNILIAGEFFSDSINFDNMNLLNPNGIKDLYIVKYDSTGTVLNANTAGDINDDNTTAVTFDNFGNVIVVGNFSSPSITFGSITLVNGTLITWGTHDSFVAKFDQTGSIIWAKTDGIIYYDKAMAVTTDRLGNVIIAGQNISTITFGSTTLNPGIYVLKYDSLGNLIWAKSTDGGIKPEVNFVNADIFGNIFITGNYNYQWAIIGNDTLNNFSFPGFKEDVFIAKLDNLTGLFDLNQEEAFTIAPNPFSSQTTISFINEQIKDRIRIFDVHGKVIKEIYFKGKQLIISRDEMKDGIYFVEATDKNNYITVKKIIVN